MKNDGGKGSAQRPTDYETFANKFDVAHVTTPTPPNQDAALRKIEEDAKKATPIPENIRAKMAELLKGKV